MRHWRVWALVGVAVWMVCVAFWAVDPMTITVTVGKNADGSDKTATVQCDSPLSGSTDPTGALPVLPAGETFGGTPCEGPVSSGRTLFLVDVCVTAGVLLVLTLSRRHREPRADDDTALARSGPVGA